MEYETIQPPFTKKFDEMSKTELKEYNRWFHQVLPERIQELVKAVKSTSGFEGWVPDFTPDSLYVLGDWLALQVETRQLSRAEYEQKYQEVNKGVRFPIDISDREMSIRTVSLAMDTGMYLSEVFLRNHATLSWTQTFKGVSVTYITAGLRFRALVSWSSNQYT